MYWLGSRQQPMSDDESKLYLDFHCSRISESDLWNRHNYRYRCRMRHDSSAPLTTHDPRTAIRESPWPWYKCCWQFATLPCESRNKPTIAGRGWWVRVFPTLSTCQVQISGRQILESQSNFSPLIHYTGLSVLLWTPQRNTRRGKSYSSFYGRHNLKFRPWIGV
jgi:hypothetical protein